MVWWTNKYQERYFRTGVRLGRALPDRIFQAINIMFTFQICHADKLLSDHKKYDSSDIYKLLSAGVNIFNVDRTCHMEDFYNDIKTAVKVAEVGTEMFPPKYLRPVGLSVTLSAMEPIDIDERIDIVTLKDIKSKEQFMEFKKKNVKITSMPILLWLSEFEMEDTNELIKLSDGIVVDIGHLNLTGNFCCRVLQFCKEACKPIFYSKPSLLEDYYDASSVDRHLLVVAKQLVNDNIHGVVLLDSVLSEGPPVDLIKSLVKSMRIIEDVEDVAESYTQKAELQPPLLDPLTMAVASSLAALKCGANAIIVLTTSGQSARILFFTSPPCHILAITSRKSTARRMHIYRKIIPLLYSQTREDSWRMECRNRVLFGTDFALKTDLFGNGAKLVVLAPSEEGIGYCDSFQVVSMPFKYEQCF